MEGEERKKDVVYLFSQFPRYLQSATEDPKPLRPPPYLVGETTMTPTWCFLIGASKRSSFSTRGIKNAIVFPLPVTASTTTSLFPMKSGIVEA